MPRPRTDIQPRILAAARTRFSERGVDAASLRGIAKEAGTSIGMVYYYYPTKDDLFLAVIEEVYVGFLQDLEQTLSSAVDFEERMSAFYQRVGRVSPLEIQIIRLVVMEGLISSSRLAQVVERFKRGHIPLVVQSVLAGIKQGKLRTDLHPMVLILSTALLGTIPQLLATTVREATGLKPPAPATLSIQLLDVLLRGIGRPTSNLTQQANP